MYLSAVFFLLNNFQEPNNISSHLKKKIIYVLSWWMQIPSFRKKDIDMK